MMSSAGATSRMWSSPVGCLERWDRHNQDVVQRQNARTASYPQRYGATDVFVTSPSGSRLRVVAERRGYPLRNVGKGGAFDALMLGIVGIVGWLRARLLTRAAGGSP